MHEPPLLGRDNFGQEDFESGDNYFWEDFVKRSYKGRLDEIWERRRGYRFFGNQSQEGRISISSQVEGPMGET